MRLINALFHLDACAEAGGTGPAVGPLERSSSQPPQVGERESILVTTRLVAPGLASCLPRHSHMAQASLSTAARSHLLPVHHPAPEAPGKLA